MKPWLVRATTATILSISCLVPVGAQNAVPEPGQLEAPVVAQAESGSGEVADVTDASFRQDVLRSSKPVLVDCYATWCGPCKSMAPIVDKLAKKYQGEIKVMRLDVERNPRMAKMLGIQGVPTFYVFKDGKPVQAVVGAMSRQSLTAMVTQSIGL